MGILDVLGYFTGLETFRAYFYGQNGALDLGLHPDDVGKPGSPGTILRMGNIIAEQSAFTANITYSGHDWTPNVIVRVLYRNSV